LRALTAAVVLGASLVEQTLGMVPSEHAILATLVLALAQRLAEVGNRVVLTRNGARATVVMRRLAGEAEPMVSLATVVPGEPWMSSRQVAAGARAILQLGAELEPE